MHSNGCLPALNAVADATVAANSPRCATWFANLFFPAILLLVAIFCMFVGQAVMSLVLLIVAALSVCMILCWRAQLELAAQLLALGSNTLLENGGLIPVKIICMIMEVIFTIPILIFIVASNVQDGDWAGSTSGGECQSVCAWSTSGSASTYYHFVSASCAHAHPPTIPLPLTRRCSLPGSLC